MDRKLVANKKRLAKKAKRGFRGFPVGSLTYYGPDDSRASKLVAGIIEQLPSMGNLYVTIDIDSLDPSIAPGTGSPAVDGLLYHELREILEGVAAKGHVVGFDLTEVSPGPDGAGREWNGNVGARVLYKLAGFGLLTR